VTMAPTGTQDRWRTQQWPTTKTEEPGLSGMKSAKEERPSSSLKRPASPTTTRASPGSQSRYSPARSSPERSDLEPLQPPLARTLTKLVASPARSAWVLSGQYSLRPPPELSGQTPSMTMSPS
jgi:hypothetical protein